MQALPSTEWPNRYPVHKRCNCFPEYLARTSHQWCEANLDQQCHCLVGSRYGQTDTPFTSAATASLHVASTRLRPSSTWLAPVTRSARRTLINSLVGSRSSADTVTRASRRVLRQIGNQVRQTTHSRDGLHNAGRALYRTVFDIPLLCGNAHHGC